MKKTKILLYGVGTYKNRGIEAIVQSTINQIDKSKYDIEVATFDYENNKKKYTDIVSKYINHYKKSEELNEEEKQLEDKYKNMPFDHDNFELLYQKEVVDEIDNVDICFSSGGDNYCYDGCYWLYSIDKTSNKKDKKTVLWGASLYEKIENKELLNDLQNFDVLVIRESISYNELKRYVPEDKIILTSDPAFSLEAKETKLDKWYKGRNYVVLNVSPLTIKSDEQFDEVIDLMNYILDKTKYSICLLPHVTTEDCNDIDILQKLKDKFNDNDRIYLEKNDYSCNELKYIISKSTLTVAARTHASIAAYSTCVPTLVIGYSVKSKGIAKDIFGEFENYVIPKDNLKDGLLIEKFKYLDSNKDKIKQVLEDKMPNYIKEAKDIFNKVINKINEQKEREICNPKKCIGCGLCSKVCPKGAIEMVEDAYGFKYPKINMDKCIHCDLCRKNCPIKNKLEKSKYKKEYYAAKSKDKEAKKMSSSGGLFSVLAETCFKNHGTVYGCQMENFKLKHIRITSKDELYKVKGSKYAQSNIIEIYDLVKKDLDDKKEVLFTGTPCQIGALKQFLKKDYPNLITASVICHGVANEKILAKQIEEIEQEENKKVESINFRSKGNGWSRASIEYDFEDSKIINLFGDDSFMNLYLKNIILRDSCYNCSYKDDNNIADIILGDYWGIEVTNKEFFDDEGVTLLIINSLKGKKYLKDNKVFDKIEYTSGSYEDTLRFNPLLFGSPKIPDDRIYCLSRLKHCQLKYINNLFYEKVLEEKNKSLLEEKNNLLNEVEYLRGANGSLSYELESIKNSKRFRVINKVGNAVNKIRRKKAK